MTKCRISDEMAFFEACVRGRLRTYFERAPAAPGGRPFVSERCDECLWSAKLTAIGEPRLDRPTSRTDGEAYRFLWLRSFEPGVALRIERTASRAIVTGKMFPEGTASDTGDRTFSKARCSVSLEIFDRVAKQVESAQYWSLETHARDGRVYLDGESWILEGVRDGRHHVVYRHSPDSGAFRAACLYLIVVAATALHPRMSIV